MCLREPRGRGRDVSDAIRMYSCASAHVHYRPAVLGGYPMSDVELLESICM